MDRVFVSNRGSPKKSIFKQLMGGSGKTKRRQSDANTEYFPYAGGDGIDGYDFNPQHMSYEPAESMLDTDIHIEEDSSHRLRRNMKKVLLRGSKYEVYHQPKSGSTTTDEESDDNDINPSPLSRSAKSSRNPTRNSSGAYVNRGDDHDIEYDSGAFSEFWTLQWVNNIPTSIEGVVPIIRNLAQKSIILRPLDTLGDQIDGIEPVVAGMEVFIFMLFGDLMSRVLRFVCYPSVFIVKLIMKIF